MAEEQAHVVESLAEGLRSLSDGDLTFRLPEQFPETTSNQGRLQHRHRRPAGHDPGDRHRHARGRQHGG